MEEKAQTSIEMLLLLGGVVLIALIIAGIIKTQLTGAGETIQDTIPKAGEQTGNI
jgi:uncharacterized protein (UPF0333 family)